ncbi:unnamed protein product [Wickerhamomyces anomalus]
MSFMNREIMPKSKMQLFKSLLYVLFLSFVTAQSTSSWMTYTKTITNHGRTYTKTVNELYTGQETTLPTSGTVTTTITVSNSKETYTKTMVQTYGQALGTTTHLTVKNPSETYTKTLSTEIAKNEASAASESSGSSSSTSSSEAGAGPLKEFNNMFAYAFIIGAMFF